MTTRYLAYATAMGRTVDKQKAHDRAEFPGGRMAGFIVWMHARWRAFFAEEGLKARPSHITADMHVRFDAWLETHPGETDQIDGGPF